METPHGWVFVVRVVYLFVIEQANKAINKYGKQLHNYLLSNCIPSSSAVTSNPSKKKVVGPSSDCLKYVTCFCESLSKHVHRFMRRVPRS